MLDSAQKSFKDKVNSIAPPEEYRDSQGRTIAERAKLGLPDREGPMENDKYSLNPTQQGTNTRAQTKQDAAYAKTRSLQEGLADKQEGWEAQERGIKNRDELVVGSEDTERKAEGAAAIAKSQLGGAAGDGAAALEGAKAAEDARQQNAAQDIINARQRKDEYHDREKRSGQAATQTRLGAVGTEQDRYAESTAYNNYLQRNREANQIQDQGAQQNEQDTAPGQGDVNAQPDAGTTAQQETPAPQEQQPAQQEQPPSNNVQAQVQNITDGIIEAGQQNAKGMDTATYWRMQAGPLIKSVQQIAGQLDDAAKQQIRDAFAQAFPKGYGIPENKQQVEAALGGTPSDMRIKRKIQPVVSDEDLKCIVTGLTWRKY